MLVATHGLRNAELNKCPFTLPVLFIIATTPLVPAMIIPQVKDSNAVFSLDINLKMILESIPNQSIVNCRTRPIFYKQLDEEPSRDQHEAKWNIPTVR